MEIQERINNYWSIRSDDFSTCRRMDMEGPQRKIWTDIIGEAVPVKNGLKALDIGTGAGFFAFILTDMGFQVTGIDYSKKMLENAEANSERLGYKGIKFLKMNAEELELDDESFDLVISRNVTWTLPNPEKAYREWCRVLLPGGVIMNFDANYGRDFKQADEMGLTYKDMQRYRSCSYNRPKQTKEMIRERNDIARELYICSCTRPQWDVNVLIQNNIDKITLDTDINRRIYQGAQISKEEDTNVERFPESKMFMICGIKQK